jgi:hypothetical protein
MAIVPTTGRPSGTAAVAGYETGGVDLARAPAAHHGRTGNLEPEQRLHRPVGPQFGEKADRDVEQQHGGDGGSIRVIALHHRDGGRGHQQCHDHSSQLREENGPDRGGWGALEEIGAGASQPAVGLAVGQSGRGRAHPGQDLMRRERVPGRRLGRRAQGGSRHAATLRVGWSRRCLVKAEAGG